MLREVTREEYKRLKLRRTKYLVLLDEFIASGYFAAEVPDCKHAPNISRAIRHYGKGGTVKVVTRNGKIYLVNKLREEELK